MQYFKICIKDFDGNTVNIIVQLKLCQSILTSTPKFRLSWEELKTILCCYPSTLTNLKDFKKKYDYE